MIDQVKAVLNFSAFRPEPDDPAATWRSRFGGRSSVLLHTGRNSLALSVWSGKGASESMEAKQGDLKELFVELAPLIKDAAHDAWCSVSLDTRYVISIESNLSRKKGSEEALKKDPRSVLHARYEKGKRYAATHNPETNSSLLLTVDEEHVKKIETLCRENKIKVGRIFCGTYALLRHALSEVNTKKGSEAPVSAFFLACCGGSVCALVQDKDNWIELRSRPDVYTGELEPLVDLIKPFAERVPPDAPLVVACDEPIPGLDGQLAEIFPGHPLNDLTKPGLLNELAYRN